MKVILFGATGMVGQGVLRECLRDDGVEGVVARRRYERAETRALHACGDHVADGYARAD